MKPKMIAAHMAAATIYANLSSARRLKVGAIIVKDDRIISIGYNGMPAGWDNNCEDQVWDKGAGGWLSPEEFDAQYPFEGYYLEAQRNVRYGLKTKPEVLHAEANAIAKVARSVESAENSILFVTHAPCLECAKLIYQSGIKKVYYRDTYRTTDGLTFLTKAGIIIEQQQGESND
jgi:dCMP deaminase